MLFFPVRLAETNDGKVRVTFFDVPEAVAEAATEQEALFQAKFALEHSLGQYVLHGREIPTPSNLPEAPAVSTDKFSPASRAAAEAGADAHPAPGGGRY